MNNPTCDRVIRDRLLEDLRSDKNNLKVINELDINNSRADIAVIDKKYFCGYEIKSDVDSLKRLPMQIMIYNYIFDKITIVVGKSKLLKAINTIPDYWGIILAKEGNSDINLIQIRFPELNKNINKNWLSKKLWKSDIVGILKAKNLYKGKSYYCRNSLLKILMDNISLDELRFYIRGILIKRVY